MFKAFIRRSSRQQWIIFLSMLSLLLVSVVTAFMWYVLRDGLLDSVNRSRELARTAAAKLELILSDDRTILEKIAGQPSVRNFETEPCDPIFRTLTEFSAGQFDRVTLVATDGRLICEPSVKANGREAITRSHPWFIKGIKSDGFSVGEPFLSYPSGKWIIPLSYVVRNDNGDLVGLVVLSLDLTNLGRRIFEGVDDVEGFRAVVVDANGNYVLHSDPTLIGARSDMTGAIIEPLGPSMNRVYGLDKTWRLVGAAEVAGSNWRVFAGLPEDIALAEARRTSLIAAVLGLFALILFAMPAVWFGRVSVRRDETRRRQVDELTELQQFMWDNIPEGAAFFNDQGIILDANNQLAEILDRSRSEIIGHKLNEYTAGDSSSVSEELREKGINRWTTRFKRPDGSIIDIETKVQRFAAGTRQLYIGVFRDFTELKRAEDDLHKSQDLLEQTGRVAGVGGWEIDLVEMKPRWTDQTKRLHEVPPDFEPTLETAIQFYPPEAREKITRAVNEGITAGKSWDLELPFITATGRSIWVRAQGRAVVENGKVVRLVGAFQDVTARRLAEQQLEDARARAEIASNAKSSFIAIMSHEIRTPLTGLLGMADLLLSEHLTPQQRGLAERLARSGRVLLDLINDVLDFSKIEANKLMIERITFVPEDIFASVKDLLEPIAKEKALALKFNIHDGLSAPALGDPKRFRQVLVNLIGNALKFTDKGQVEVTAAPQPAAGPDFILRVDVADTGPGISAEAQRNLFKPYVQGGSQTSKRAPGTGLGLSISRLLVEAMGGTIGFTSTPGQGSVFWFTVKLQNYRANALATPTRPQVEAGKLRSLRLLSAEDNETSRFLINAMLERKGHRVDSVVNGAEAVEAAKAKDYDLILMDMQMPVMDGMEAVRQIRQLPSPNAKIPIIALTADLIGENRSLYLASGVNAIVGKPVDWATLEAEMAAQLAAASANGGSAYQAPAPAPTNTQEEILLDQAAHTDMRNALGAEKFAQLLQMLKGNLVTYQNDLSNAAEAGDLTRAKRAAHAMRGLAIQFGARKVAAQAEEIEVKARSIEHVREMITALQQSITDTIKTIGENEHTA